jgi:hypothetical protein
VPEPSYGESIGSRTPRVEKTPPSLSPAAAVVPPPPPPIVGRRS